MLHFERVTSAAPDTISDFLLSCTMTAPTPVSIALVHRAADAFRGALGRGELGELRAVVASAEKAGLNAADLLGAAQQVIMDDALAAPAHVSAATWKALLALGAAVLPLEPFDHHELDAVFAPHSLVG